MQSVSNGEAYPKLNMTRLSAPAVFHVCIVVTAVAVASWGSVFWRQDTSIDWSSVGIGTASVAFASAALIYGLRVIVRLAFTNGAKYQRLMGRRAHFAEGVAREHGGQEFQGERLKSSAEDGGETEKQLPTQRSAPEMRELKKFAARFRDERAKQTQHHAERRRRERRQQPQPQPQPQPQSEPPTARYPDRRRPKKLPPRQPRQPPTPASVNASPQASHKLPSLRSAPEMRGLKLWRAETPHESQARAPLRRLGVNIACSWTIPFRDIELDQIVGMGSWGRVYAGRFLGSRVAIKELMGSNVNVPEAHDASGNGKRERAAQEALRAFQAESDILMGLHHSAVIELFGICESPSGMLYIVTEFCELDLTTLIANGKAHGRYLGMYDVVLWRDLACQLCCGMRYLHSKNIMHRDLKPDNVVLVPLAPGRSGMQRYQAKICDFGISKRIVPGAAGDLVQHTRAVGTPLYMAPEVLMGERRKSVYSFESDIYSFGIMLWMLWCGKVPFDDLEGSVLDLMTAVLRGRRPHFHEDDRWPSGVVAFVRRLWASDPRARPTFAQMQEGGMMSFDALFCGTATPSDDDDGDGDDEHEDDAMANAGVDVPAGSMVDNTPPKVLLKLSEAQAHCGADSRSIQPTPSTGLSASSSAQLSAASSVLASDSDPDVAAHGSAQCEGAVDALSDLSDTEPETRLRGFTDVVDETVGETFE